MTTTTRIPPQSPSRRRFCGILAALTACPLLFSTGCDPRNGRPLRIASNLFPGYEVLHLAKRLGYFASEGIRTLDMPSATACLQALAAGVVDGAGLTLDEVITAQSDGIPLVIIAVLDVSLGADVVLARPPIATLDQLRGARIGIEETAVGAVMLATALHAGGLTAEDVHLHYATVDTHLDLYQSGEVDALVTFDPVPLHLEPQGANRLFDSSRIPGKIIDVLAVRREIVDSHGDPLRQLLRGYFRALADLQSGRQREVDSVAARLKIPPDQLQQAYSGLQMVDLAGNRTWLSATPSPLLATASDLQEIMLDANLLRAAVDLTHLATDQFLPPADAQPR